MLLAEHKYAPANNNKSISSSDYFKTFEDESLSPVHGRAVQARIEDQISRMFKEKVLIFDSQVEFRCDDIIISILKIVLKAFYETIRLKTYNQNAFQQIQVDTHYIRTVLQELIPENRFDIINSLLLEAYSSAVDRCVEPNPLAKTILIQKTETKIKNNNTHN